MGSQSEIQVEFVLSPAPADNMNPRIRRLSTIAILIVFSVATQGLFRQGEDHLFHRVDPPQDRYPPLEVLPMATPPPREGRRKCYPACKGGAGFCQGRCVFFGMVCVQGKCSRSPYF